MPIIHFYAWINRNDPIDPGHLVMYDCKRLRTLEITQVVLKPNEVNSRYVDIGPPSTTVTDKRTATPYTARSSPIVLTEEELTFCVTKQLQKSRKGATRFTHVYKVAVRVTEVELTEIRQRMALAKAGGQYNLFAEARVNDPTAGRCLLPLEVLASARGNGSLQGANAFEYLRSFMKWSPHSCFGENGAVLSDPHSLARLFGFLRVDKGS